MISLVLPTRGRPDFLNEFWTSAIENAHRPNDIEMCLYVDDDDEPTIKSLPKLPFQQNIKTMVGKRILLANTWNCAQILGEGEIFMHCGDDIRFRSKNWDLQIKNVFEEYPDRIVFVHGVDGFQPKTFGTHGCVHKNWINTLGYFTAPYFSSDYCDTWLNEIANNLGRRVCIEELYTEHLHPAAGKHTWDTTHLERLERHGNDNVNEVYNNLAHQRLKDTLKLQLFIDGFNKHG